MSNEIEAMERNKDHVVYRLLATKLHIKKGTIKTTRLFKTSDMFQRFPGGFTLINYIFR